MSTKRSVNDLFTPTVSRDALWQIVKRAGITKPPFNRADMQEPLYTMIMTAFFAVILLVIGVVFAELAGLVLVLMALVCTCFGYEWHTWATMRRLNHAAEDIAQVEAYERSVKLMRLAQQAKAKREPQKTSVIRPLRKI